ncbi:N-acetylneuraminate synthase family protein [Phaeodactylibacter sp.]|uniref:N-acetylneuraminate synthase family protein n=1 Tax=Phaeodactylibacter sp. TaxID=1940289 RepID=UPI0032EE56FC
MDKSFKIGNTPVGPNHPPYYIADIGANHDGKLERAFKLIELAKEAGANAAKFQNFQASKIVSEKGFKQFSRQLSHQENWKKSVFETYQDASINKEWTAKLKEKCDEVGIEYFTSPYDFESVDLVDPFVDIYKIGSGDITWIDIIEFIFSKNKPVLIATGASEMEDVERVMKVANKYDNPVCLMQCNTNYTVDADKYKYVNLNVLNTYKESFPDVVLGLSDHTLGCATVGGAIAIGARIIEKHFTDDNHRDGPDHKFAMNPALWRTMVDLGNEIYCSLGDGVKKVEENEKDSLVVQQRSLRAVANMKIGSILKKEDIVVLRPKPEASYAPYFIDELVGKELKKSIAAGEHFTEKHFN